MRKNLELGQVLKQNLETRMQQFETNIQMINMKVEKNNDKINETNQQIKLLEEQRYKLQLENSDMNDQRNKMISQVGKDLIKAEQDMSQQIEQMSVVKPDMNPPIKQIVQQQFMPIQQLEQKSAKYDRETQELYIKSMNLMEEVNSKIPAFKKSKCYKYTETELLQNEEKLEELGQELSKLIIPNYVYSALHTLEQYANDLYNEINDKKQKNSAELIEIRKLYNKVDSEIYNRKKINLLKNDGPKEPQKIVAPQQLNFSNELKQHTEIKKDTPKMQLK